MNMKYIKIVIIIGVLACILGWLNDKSSFVKHYIVKPFASVFISVDGKYGAWSKWTECSATCGTGERTRFRYCDCPPSLGRGKGCNGPSTQSESCKIADCKVNGGFGEWSTWSACSKTCGGGQYKRARKCNNPSPSNGGENCHGPLEELKACVNDLCNDASSIAKVQEKVKEYLKNVRMPVFSDKTANDKNAENKSSKSKPPSGKFYKSIFAIQKVVADEFASVDPTVKKKPVEKRLDDLEKILKTASDGGSMTFARTTLGKSLYTYTKKKIKDGIAIDDLDVAAKAYLDKLKETIGSDKMSDILSSQGDVTLMFVIDTTSSMSEEINAAKAIARGIINQAREFDVDYILSPFNDPTTGPVIYKPSKEKENFVSAINDIRINGGGDCPELTFQGMLNAIDYGPKYGSPMFVFTDASAKDDTLANIAALKAAAAMSGTTISFFTHLAGCSKGVDSFKDIASDTAGLVFPLKTEAELLKFTEYVKTSLEQDTLIASGGKFGNVKLGGKPQTFNVDNGISKLIVSVTVTMENHVGKIILKSPSGNLVRFKKSMSMAIIYEVENPVTGLWELTIPDIVGNYEYVAHAVSNQPIEFSYSFVYQENPSRNSPFISLENPIKGRENLMIVQIGGVSRIAPETLRVDIVGVHGNEISSNLKITPMDSEDIYNITIKPPETPFKIRLRGKTISGEEFQRISREVARPATSHMRPTYAGDEFTAKLGATEIPIQMQVLNIGNEDTFKFKATSNFGSIEPMTQTKSIRNSGFISLKFKPPAENKYQGSIGRVTVTANKRGSNEIISNNVNILLVQ